MSFWEPGLEFVMPEEVAPFSLTDCCQCGRNSLLLELSWHHVCLPSLPMLLLPDDHCGVDTLLPHSLSIFPWVKISEGLCMHTKY